MSKKLKQLEREQDIATLEFWNAIEAKKLAESRYYLAEAAMFAAKTEYLKEKLSGRKP